MWIDGSTTGLAWCALAALAPLLVGTLYREPELGFAAFIGAASIGAVGGTYTAVLMALFFCLLIAQDARSRASHHCVNSPGVWLSARPTRMKLKAPIAGGSDR